jgi:hypothetical protein
LLPIKCLALWNNILASLTTFVSIPPSLSNFLNKEQKIKNIHAQGLRKFYSYIARITIEGGTINLAIFGAGASYGSDTSNVPPLMNELFEALAAFAPSTWGKLPEKYRKLFQNDFEQGMQTLSNEHNALLPPLQRDMAAYFFNFLPRKSNLYCKMANLIKGASWNFRGVW